METINYEDCTEEKIIHHLQQGQLLALLYLYRSHREDLIRFTCAHSIPSEAAVALVDELFSELWINWRFQHIKSPIRDFLLLRMRDILELYKEAI